VLYINEVWLYLIAGVLTGIIFSSVYWDQKLKQYIKNSEQELQEKESIWGQELTLLKTQNETLNKHLNNLQEQLTEYRINQSRLQERTNRLTSVENELNQARKTITVLEKETSVLQVQIEEERKTLELQLKEFNKSKEIMQDEFKAIATQIMENNSQRFGKVSKDGLEEVLKPLQQQVMEFKKRIEQVHTEETKGMATLLNEIQHLKNLNMKISEDAINLTKALRGESKQQGIWGEIVLERVLKASGLREGEEYEREVSLKNLDNQRYRPDVIVHLPNDRDIIIDAKTSLVDYEQYISSEKEKEKKLYAKRHLKSIKNHIINLSDKNYTQLEGLNTPDFIFMFIPIDRALLLALETDRTLYDTALSKNIILVSPTTLLVALRAVENTWRHDRQNKNALVIAKRAGDLYDKFVSFSEDLEKIGKQIETTQKTYDGAWKKLTKGRGNLVDRAKELKILGARTSKKMPKKISDDADINS